MAKVVIGVGCSHSPMLATTADDYFVHADKDRMRRLMGRDGAFYSFDELIAQAPTDFGGAMEMETIRKRLTRCSDIIDGFKAAIAKAAPDFVVVIGDDQMELFLDNNMPCFSVYWGSEYTNLIPTAYLSLPGVALAAWQMWDDTPTKYPSQPDFGRFLVTRLIDDKFDVAQFSEQSANPQTGGMSHAHTFVHKRLVDPSVPIVPVFINTYYPPNQPSMGRCIDFGRSIRRAVDAWDSDARVAIVASGGLSHFVIDESLDRRFLDALKNNDEQAMLDIPERNLKSGNSELKLWATLWAAMSGHSLSLMEYFPLYRSEAATGTAVAFAEWH